MYSRSIAVLNDNSIHKIVTSMRADNFDNDITNGMANVFQSTVYYMLKTSILFGL